MNSPYFDTFAAAIDKAFDTAYAADAVFACPTDLWSICQEPLNYGQSRSLSVKLESLKGKPTKKYFHTSIVRMDSGKYELTNYIL